MGAFGIAAVTVAGTVASAALADTDAGNRAANEAQAANNAAIGQLRDQFDSTSGNLQPFIDAGQGALSGLEQGSTASGLDARLGEIFQGGNFQNLVGERTRALQNQQSAVGLNRSGAGLQNIANVPTELGFNIEQLLTGRLGNLASQGLGAATNLGSFGAQTAASSANLTAGIGEAEASGILTDSQATAARNEALIGGLTSAAGGFAGGGGGSGSMAGFAFSDPRLKENTEMVGMIGDLPIYQWDWIEEVDNTIIDKNHNVGFMADEVKAKYPEYVYEFGGFDCIDYPELLNRLEEESNSIPVTGGN